MKIENRTFVVSGGSSGLGLATVRELLSAQGYVAILDRKTPPSLDEIARDASSDRSHLLFVEMNILKVEEVESAVEKVVSWTKETGAHLGGLINGAGVAEAEVLINLNGVPHSERLWNRVIGINLNGTFHLTRLLVPHLIHVPPEDTADAERGVVVMISSTVAYEGLVGQIAYAASKGAIRSMTLPMARDLARYNIRTVTLAPGPFTTPMTRQFTPKVTEGLHRDAVLYPRRYGKAEEFAQTVKWILECPYINGENFKLTGGLRVPGRLPSKL